MKENLDDLKPLYSKFFLGDIGKTSCCISDGGVYNDISRKITKSGSLRFIAVHLEKKEAFSLIEKIIEEARDSCDKVCPYKNKQVFMEDVLYALSQDPDHHWEGSEKEIEAFLRVLKERVEKYDDL